MTVKTIWLAVIMLMGFIYYTCRRDVIKLDGILGELLMLIASPETRYAKHYTHSGFTKVQKGMTEQEVMNILGKPLVRWPCNKNFSTNTHYVCLQYSESPSGTHYRLRQVCLDNGKVAEVIACYYID